MGIRPAACGAASPVHSWPHTAGAVLAGGLSSRMGQDKASIALADGTMLERAWRLVADLVAPAWVCCAPGKPRPGYPSLTDEKGGEGPARGVASALRAAAEHGAERVLILACDLPCLQGELLVSLLNAPVRPGSLACVYASAATGRAEMLVGIYAVAALPLLLAGLAHGERSLFRLIPPERLQLLTYAPELAPLFLNCNSMADLARLQGTVCPALKNSI